MSSISTVFRVAIEKRKESTRFTTLTDFDYIWAHQRRSFRRDFMMNGFSPEITN